MSNDQKSSKTNNSGGDSGTDEPINKQTLKEDYGYNFFTERSAPNSKEDRSSSTSSSGTGFSSVFSSVKDNILIFDVWKKVQHLKCEKNVVWCTKNDPLVKLMVRALKSHGCEVNLNRHFSCEPCLSQVNGGYDPLSNQAVVCQNVTKRRLDVCSVLGHELTHAFDRCRTKMDFTNLDHLACTEIRASNFSHCSYAFAIANGNAKPWDYKEAHQLCVKNRAAQSVMMVRNVSADKAMETVDKVFDKCYSDLEPVGRIPRKRTRDAHLALVEGELYGYS